MANGIKLNKKITKPLNSFFSWAIKKQKQRINLFLQSPISTQNQTLTYLIKKGNQTFFGEKYNFSEIKNYSDFKNQIPLQNYTTLQPYIQQIIEGRQKVLWEDEIKWFAKSSGTTSGKSKFIPVSKETIEDCHYRGGKDLIGMYYINNPSTRLFNGKHLILGGSSQINNLTDASYFGDLSAIIVKNLPWWCEWRRTPNRKITLMEDWEIKLPEMVKNTIKEDVMILAGVPSWTLVFLKQVLEYTGKSNIMDVWPNLELYMHGGVNFNPYKNQFEKIIQNPNMNYIQTYNASEGFFAIQDRNQAEDMLLMLDYGIFYEFIPLQELKKKNPQAISLKDIKINTNYALVITTTSGLWRYIIGDVIKFTSLNPHRIIVTGRTTHYINTFGEELIIENTDQAIEKTCRETQSTLKEYTVAPIFMSDKETGGHEWLIEFYIPPKDLQKFTLILDHNLKEINSDYDAKRSHNLTLRPPVIHLAKNNLFHNWLKQKNKLGGQHKIPRLLNTRETIEELLALNEE